MTKTPEALARQHERTEKRRDQVLDAAEACFRREGFHAASVNRIAAEAGMSVGHLYRYFDSQDEIILALFESTFAEFISQDRKSGVSGKRVSVRVDLGGRRFLKTK